jgi:hypothetical protein
MRRLTAVLLVASIGLPTHASENLTMKAAVELAEKFVADNGYTDLPEPRIKPALDGERIEWRPDRQGQLAERFDTLVARAIGAKAGKKHDSVGWSVAFDYKAKRRDAGVCRVVTMSSTGTDIRVAHVDGVRDYFVGFKNK